MTKTCSSCAHSKPAGGETVTLHKPCPWAGLTTGVGDTNVCKMYKPDTKERK